MESQTVVRALHGFQIKQAIFLIDETIKKSPTQIFERCYLFIHLFSWQAEADQLLRQEAVKEAVLSYLKTQP